MAMIEINNEVFHYQIKNEINLQTLLPEVKKKYSYQKFNYTYIGLNGLSISPDHDKMSLLRPLSETDHIKLTLDGNPYMDFIENLEQLSKSITTKITSLDFDLAHDYKKDLEQVMAGIGVFIQSSSYIVRRLKSRYPALNDTPVKNLQIHLLSVLKGIESAHKNQDLIMLEDLLEFELKDNLTKWKILVIPSLKTQVKSPT